MLQLIPLTLDILIGVFFSLGVLFLLIGFSGRQLKLSVIFALLSFIMIAYLFGQKFAYSALTPEAFMRANKFNFCILSLIGVALSWFIHYYLRDKSKWKPIVVSLVFLVVLLVNCAMPHGIMFDEVTSITRLTFPWGEKYSIPSGLFNQYNLLLDFAIILFVANMINAFFVLRRRDRNIISVVWAALVILILAAIVNDYLIAKGRINSLYLLELSLAIFLIVMCVVIITETYEELALLEKMKERLHSFESMIENIDLIVISLNRMGNVEYVNPFYLELTGYEPEEVLGKDWFANFIPQKITYDTQGVFLEILKNDFEPHYENPIILKNGNSVHVKWHNVRLVDLDGKVSGSLSIGIPEGKVNSEK